MHVHTIMRALKELCSRNLYKTENISINSNWNHILELDNKGNKFDDDNIDSKSETNSISESERPTETLVHGFIASQRIHDLQDKLIEIAPAEGQRPLGIFKDKHAEEMSFPTLFFGNPRGNDILQIFRYQEIVKWELMHCSGHFSYHITNLFFNTMQIIIENVMSCISVRI